LGESGREIYKAYCCRSVSVVWVIVMHTRWLIVKGVWRVGA